MAQLYLDPVVRLAGGLKTKQERRNLLNSMPPRVVESVKNFNPCSKERGADASICDRCSLPTFVRCQVLKECREALKDDS